MNYGRADQILRCRDCDEKFVFSAREQERFDANGYPAPIRCPECRLAKRVRYAGREHE